MQRIMSKQCARRAPFFWNARGPLPECRGRRVIHDCAGLKAEVAGLIRPPEPRSEGRKPLASTYECDAQASKIFILPPPQTPPGGTRSDARRADFRLDELHRARDGGAAGRPTTRWCMSPSFGTGPRRQSSRLCVLSTPTMTERDSDGERSFGCDARGAKTRSCSRSNDGAELKHSPKDGGEIPVAAGSESSAGRLIAYEMD